MGGNKSKDKDESDSVVYSEPKQDYSPEQNADGEERDWAPLPPDVITRGHLYVAKHDFDGLKKKKDEENQLDMPFKKGWHILVLEKTSKKWWLAQSGSRSGYVPVSFLEEKEIKVECGLYFPKASRKDIFKCLYHATEGQFLMRQSTSKSVAVKNRIELIVKSHDSVIHFRINIAYIPQKKSKFKELFYIDSRFCFYSVDDLINHYADNDGLPVRLDPTPTYMLPQYATANDKPKESSHKKEWREEEWEISRENLILEESPLGSGQFGEVFKGRWFDAPDEEGNSGMQITVAVKTLKEGHMEPKAFRREAEVMTKLKHRNLVRIYGVCIASEPLFIITEFCDNGSLLNYLKEGDGQTCEMQKLIRMISDVAAGMNYLEDENVVHRDLAARNVLLTKKWHCKVADFGLARLIENETYLSSKGTKLPVRWTAPEGINDNKFTTKSDVWSFGVLCYEITSRGLPPYKGVPSPEIWKKLKEEKEPLKEGYRLPKPDECPVWLYLVMHKCWKISPRKRYTFRHIRKIIKKFSSEMEEDEEGDKTEDITKD